jgi:N-acetylglucosaminyl-diphospho-decaprenol L-rhamnosyltransferase
MEVATIIVNYRTAAATVEAVAAAFGEIEGLADAMIVVVDNDSGDGSLAELQAAFGADRWRGRVAVVGSGHNGGFGAGVNFGIAHVLATRGQPRYFLVLNPDSKIAPGALGRLLAFMASHPDAGLLGTVVNNAAGNQLRGFRFPSLLGELETRAGLGLVSRVLDRHKAVLDDIDTSEVDWVSGVSMLFRTEVFSSTGLFDERFFLYYEEIDLAFRIRASGWKIYFVADAVVEHIGGLSTGVGDKTRRMPKYWFDSRRRYLLKHHSRLYAAGCDAAWLCGHAIAKAKTNLLRRETESPPKLGRDFLRYAVTNLLKPAPEAEQYRAHPDPFAAPRGVG